MPDRTDQRYQADQPADAAVLDTADLITARILVVLTVVVGVVSTVGGRLWAWVVGGQVTWEGRENRSTPPEPVYEIGEDTALPTLQLTWVREHASVPDLLVSTATGWLGLAAIVVGAVVVWSLLGHARRGDPFGGRSVAALRTLGCTLLVYGLLHPVLTMASAMYLAPDPLHFVASFDVSTGWAVIVGLMVMILAQIWARGRRLRNDTVGLV